MKEVARRLVEIWTLTLACLIVLSLLAWFMVEHERFPHGSGEVWNWLLGIG